MEKPDKVSNVKDMVEFIDRLDNILSIVSAENDQIYEEFRQRRMDLVKNIFNHFDIPQKDQEVGLRDIKMESFLYAPIPDNIFGDYKELRKWWNSVKNEIKK